MDKNYYDILQVNKNASSEIIEKAYKILAKKYHPDLQTEENKKHAEEVLKEINEAYEVLSDEQKRAQYDRELSNKENENIQVNDDLLYENKNLKEELQNLKTSKYYSNINQNINNQHTQEYNKDKSLNNDNELKYQQELQQAREKAYYDAYIQDLKNRGYKIRYKKTWKDYFKSFISLVCTILVLLLLWQIPFIRNFFTNMYQENEVLHALVDIFLKLFK